ncbi:hypothetical protein BN2537_1559 [Streptomyces venezuelae]|nr:hypothetical protein BN2537_1559 [Streptomyces venezuelae]
MVSSGFRHRTRFRRSGRIIMTSRRLPDHCRDPAVLALSTMLVAALRGAGPTA